MITLPKAIYRFNTIPIKIPMAFFHRTRTNNSKICVKTQKTPIAKTILRKKNKLEVSHALISDYITKLQSWLAQKWTHRSMEQYRKPRNEPQFYGQLIYDKGGETIQWGNDRLFFLRYWENQTTICKNIKLNYFLIPYTKINSKWIKDLDIRPETIKLLEKNIGIILWRWS